MNEIRRDEIIYEEGWRDVFEPEDIGEISEDETPFDEEPKSELSKPVLMTIRLALCAIAALLLFLLKSMDSASFRDFMTFYREEMNKPLISREIFDGIDMNAIFFSDPIRVTATADEIPRR